MYPAPQAWWEFVTPGSLPSGGLRLTEAFRRSWQRAVTLLALASLAAVSLAAAIQGGWRPDNLRTAEVNFRMD